MALEALRGYMGHASITITNDRYGHALPGAGQRDAAKLDELHALADTVGRLAQLG